jgi:putative hydrolase of the HAD superfamily
LAASGCRLGIISNSDGTVEGLLRRCELCQVGAGPGVPVEFILDSGAVGFAKPSLEIFRMAVESMDVEPADAVYVGDSFIVDVLGSRSAGMHPVHFDPYGLCRVADHDHVATFAAIPALVAARAD